MRLSNPTPPATAVVRPLLAGLTLLLLAACQSPTGEIPAPQRSATDDLLALMDQRLATTTWGARAAWSRDQGLDALVDQAGMLKQAAGRAAEAGVDPAFAKAFFQAQGTASRQLATDLRADWQAGRDAPTSAPEPGAADAVTTTLARDTERLVPALVRFAEVAPGPTALDYLEQETDYTLRDGPSGTVRATAVAPLVARLSRNAKTAAQ